MMMKVVIITVLVLIIGWYMLPWWAFLSLVAVVFMWLLYTVSPHYSFGGYSFLAPAKEKILALTFTGGNTEIVNQVIHWLKEKNIPSVFFVYGKMAEESPHLIQQIVKAGHVIGISGFEPKEDWFTKPFDSDDLHKTIHRTQDALAHAIPYFHTTLFRPYRGRKVIYNPWRLKHNFGYYVVLWSFELGKDALPKIRSRMIINVSLDDFSSQKLFSQLHTLEQYAQSQGYTFVQIEI